MRHGEKRRAPTFEEVLAADEPWVALARRVSLAAHVSPALLRTMRLRFHPELAPIEEARLWRGPMVDARGPQGFVLLAAVQDHLRTQLRPPELDETWEVQRRVHRNASRLTKWGEELVFRGLKGELDRAEALLKNIIDLAGSLAQPRELARWALHAVPRMPTAVRELPLTGALAVIGSRCLGGRPILRGELEIEMSKVWPWLPRRRELEGRKVGVRIEEQRERCRLELMPQVEGVWVPREVPVVELRRGAERRWVQLPQKGSVEVGFGRLNEVANLVGQAWGLRGKRAIKAAEASAEAQRGRVHSADTSAEAPKVAPTRLGQSVPVLYGRDAELNQLDSAWKDPATKLMTIVAGGGVGKTALVHEFRNRLCMRDEPAWVFDWSFYSQGTRDVRAVSAESFIREALLFFGAQELADSNTDGWTKGAKLAELIGERRVLLILDGLEPLQEPSAAMGQAGAVREQSVRALLLGLANHSAGLCLITTRVPVAELQGYEGTTTSCLKLAQLSTLTGAALLRSLLGELPSTDAELQEICEVVNGHALSLQLLGSYIRRALGDVARWRELDLKQADDEAGGHAFRVIAAYESWLAQGGEEGQRELAVLRMMGLFDRAADPDCVEALRREPPIAGLTDALVGLDQDGWRSLLATLQEARLLSYSAYEPTAVRGYDEATALAAGELGQPLGESQPWPVTEHGPNTLVLDAHPLVREYFGAVLRREDEAAWREGHQRVYEQLQGAAPYWPDGIEGLQPLYQALVHGCAAGRVQECFTAVYWDRIRRGTRGYSTQQLGAFGANLVAVANFFERAWDRPSTELSTADRAWMLNEAAFCLRGVGRLSESLQPMRAGLEMAVELEDWKNAAIRAGNLSELELTLGRVGAAVKDATQAMAHADRSEDAGQRMEKRTTLADAQLAAGDWENARALFEQVEVLKAERQPNTPELSSLGGHRYFELLLCRAERAAWRESVTLAEASELLPHCAAVFERATRARVVPARYHWNLDVALDHLSCGRAALYAATIHARVPTLPCTLTLAQAAEQLEAAVVKLRESGRQDELPKGLLTRAWLYHLQDRDNLAQRDLDEAWSIAIRGPMPLHQADIELHRARLFRDRDALTRATTLIHKHAYNRRLAELEDAQRRVDRPDVAILIALPEMLETLVNNYTDRWTPRPNPDYPSTDFWFDGPNGYRCVATIMPRMGPKVASQAGQRLLAWKPAAIVNVGVAGGFHDDLCIGDVIVPRQIDAYDEIGKATGTEWRRRSGYRPNAVPEMHELRFSGKQAFEAWVNTGARTVGELRAGPDATDVEGLINDKLLRSEPKLSTNHLASGSFVIASKSFAEWIRSNNGDIYAGEMEGAGMMAVAEYRRGAVQTLIVRGISDHVDADKSKVDRIGEGALRRLAMANAWRLVEMLMELGKLPRADASAEEPGGSSDWAEASAAEAQGGHFRSRSGEASVEASNARPRSADADPPHAMSTSKPSGSKRVAANRAVTERRTGIELVFVPGGTFTMGLPPDIDGRNRHQAPQHKVELEGFHLARTPVTNEQYARFMAANSTVAQPIRWSNEDFNQPTQPVVGISWFDARAFCDWAGLVALAEHLPSREALKSRTTPTGMGDRARGSNPCNRKHPRASATATPTNNAPMPWPTPRRSAPVRRHASTISQRQP